jgi:hypothetical protein
MFRSAEGLKAITYNTQNEVTFCLKVLCDCHTLNVSHFNLLFRAVDKNKVAEFQSEAFLKGGNEGANSTLYSQIVGVLSNPFFVGDPQFYQFSM